MLIGLIKRRHASYCSSGQFSLSKPLNRGRERGGTRKNSLLKGWEAEREPRAFLLQGSSGNRNASLEFQFYVFEAELLQEHE